MSGEARFEAASHVRYAIWGSELSPFALKLRALCDAAALPHRLLPAEGTRSENTRIALELALAKRRRLVHRHPIMEAEDEYPLVPFLLALDDETARRDGAKFQYDSSALARWLDATHPPQAGPFFPCGPGQEAQGFAALLIDEALDEFGLYMVHHKRWVDSAETNDAGARLAAEMRHLWPPGVGGAFGRHFARRQVRRLPYLFSVAPEGYTRPGLPKALTPPSRAGFPPTHDLLDRAHTRYLEAIEHVLSSRPFLLGERFCVADASVYGQLGMNLADPTADLAMRERAPRTHAWLEGIHDGRHAGAKGALDLDDRLAPLLAIVDETFVPLMIQNRRAYDLALGRGETSFNERAFEAGRALYDGVLLGSPFRAVTRSFQARVWRDVLAAWRALPGAARARLEPYLPQLAHEVDRA